MPIDFRDRVNRILNLSTKEFGEAAVLRPASGGSFNIRGIFDNEYQSIDADTEKVVSANLPVLGVNLFDFNFEILEGDLVDLRNLTYKIIDIREDGQGGASLFLHRVNHGQKVYKKSGATSP